MNAALSELKCRTIARVLLLVAAVCCLTAARSHAESSNARTLNLCTRASAVADTDRPSLDSIVEIAAPGTPGALAVWGEGASVLAAGGADRGLLVPVAVSGLMGRGRVVALVHTGMLSAGSVGVGQTGDFVERVVRWAANSGDVVRVGHCVDGWNEREEW